MLCVGNWTFRKRKDNSVFFQIGLHGLIAGPKP